jgi:2-hydroxy-3-oxopropionate reductase
MVVAATVIALSEAAALAESSGVDVAGLLDILGGGYAASRVLQVKGANLVSQTYAPGGKAAYMVKDLGFVRDEAQHTGASVRQAGLNLDVFAAATAAGWGEEDMSVVHRLIREHQD